MLFLSKNDQLINVIRPVATKHEARQVTNNEEHEVAANAYQDGIHLKIEGAEVDTFAHALLGHNAPRGIEEAGPDPDITSGSSCPPSKESETK
jgi:hypothetical protein